MLITMSGTELPWVFTEKVNAKFILPKVLKQRGHLTFPPHPSAILETTKAARGFMSGLCASWWQLKLIHTCASPNPRFPNLRFPTCRLVWWQSIFFNHFAPSFCNILQQTKHPLLGMFSICFMLILIKEFETEQTVPSRWPYKCEISKLFYLPQNSASKFLQINPSLRESADSKERAKQSQPPNICFCYSSWRPDWWSLPLLHPQPPHLPDSSLVPH